MSIRTKINNFFVVSIFLLATFVGYKMFEDPQTIHREMIIEVDNKRAGKSKAIGMPIKFSKSKTEKSKGAPNLGEHTREIMLNFGYKQDEIEDFYNRKVIL